MGLKKGEDIGQIDLLRVLACSSVVSPHCCDAFIEQSNANRGSLLTGAFLGGLTCPCILIFVMMTGVLLFPARIDMGTFYKKRIGELIPPIIFWSLVLPALYFVYLDYINPNIQDPLTSMPDHSLEALWIKLYTFIFNLNFNTVPLWYPYMLIDLYLVTPIVSGWLEKTSKKELKLFLSIWGVSLIAPYVKMPAPMLGYQGSHGNMGLWGICDWNDYGTFYYFSGSIGYLLLAYYLTRCPLKWSWKKLLGVTIPMSLVGCLITSYGYVITQNHFPGDYVYLEIVWYFAGIDVFVMTFPVFIIVQKIKVPSDRWLSHMASLILGIYLSHYVLVFAAYDLLDKEQLPCIVRIISMARLVFLTCYAIVWLMPENKLTDRFIR